LEKLKQGLDTWDYQWQISVLNEQGLAVSPSSNLISNIGAGPGATHTSGDEGRTNLATQSLHGLDYESVENNFDLTRWYESKMGLANNRAWLKNILNRSVELFYSLFKRAVKIALFHREVPIVVASTGRAGSTMLVHAISYSLIEDRFHRWPEVFKKILRRVSVDYLDRLKEMPLKKAPVLKTHDLHRHDRCDEEKCIFVFGDPLEAAQSVDKLRRSKGDIWVDEHIYHLCGSGRASEIFEKDVLNYENQIRSWSASKKAFLVHYDDLWSRVHELSDFLGFELHLPEKRERSLKENPDFYNETLFSYLKSLEAGLRSKGSE